MINYTNYLINLQMTFGSSLAQGGEILVLPLLISADSFLSVWHELFQPLPVIEGGEVIHLQAECLNAIDL